MGGFKGVRGFVAAALAICAVAAIAPSTAAAVDGVECVSPPVLSLRDGVDWLVPVGVNWVQFDLTGETPTGGGAGAHVTGLVQVAAGDALSLTLLPGGPGGDGWWTFANVHSASTALAGGGAPELRVNGAVVAVAGGGGAPGSTLMDGGQVEVPGGAAGTPAPGLSGSGPAGGGGASAGAGGVAAPAPAAGSPGTDGVASVGGTGGSLITEPADLSFYALPGGGGGAGHFGGAGGASGVPGPSDAADLSSSGGGGGSSWLDPALVDLPMYQLANGAGLAASVVACDAADSAIPLPISLPDAVCRPPVIFGRVNATDQFVVPEGDNIAVFDAWGAAGGAVALVNGRLRPVQIGDPGAVFGNGGRATVARWVNGGDVFDVTVGGVGNLGGFNGGGFPRNREGYSTGGGGGTDIRPAGGNLASRVVAGGGAGGTGVTYPGGWTPQGAPIGEPSIVAGGAGGAVGADGTGTHPGLGATQVAPGVNGASEIPADDIAPGAGVGGAIIDYYAASEHAGGGGGGWYGGGSGGGVYTLNKVRGAGSGGGGSSFGLSSPDLPGPVYQDGVRADEGLVQIVTCRRDIAPITTTTSTTTTSTTTATTLSVTATTQVSGTSPPPPSTSGWQLPQTGEAHAGALVCAATITLSGAILLALRRRPARLR